MQSEFVSVKRMAELAGVTTQAVYRRINSDLQGFVRLDGSKKTIDTAALRYFGQQDQQPIVQSEPEITREMFDLLKSQLEVVNQKVFIKDEQISGLIEQLNVQSKVIVQLQEEKQLAIAEMEGVKQIREQQPEKEPVPWWKFWERPSK